MNSQFLVAVAKDKFRPGVNGPEHDWRDYPTPQDHPKASYEVLDLFDALHREWPTDAHLVTYIIKHPDGRPLGHQPRINKCGLEYVRSQGFLVESNVMFFDVDNPGHKSWTPELEQEAFARYKRWHDDGLRTFGIYHTSKGARFIQPLTQYVPVEKFEHQLRGYMLRFKSIGANIDEVCLDWTRHYRLPNIVRDRKVYRSHYMNN